jgi:hypothetical protein
MLLSSLLSSLSIRAVVGGTVVLLARAAAAAAALLLEGSSKAILLLELELESESSDVNDVVVVVGGVGRDLDDCIFSIFFPFLDVTVTAVAAAVISEQDDVDEHGIMMRFRLRFRFRLLLLLSSVVVVEEEEEGGRIDCCILIFATIRLLLRIKEWNTLFPIISRSITVLHWHKACMEGISK